MSPLSIARSSARHPRIVIAAWAFALVISIGLAGGFWGQGLTAERVLLADTESGAGQKLLEERFRGPRPITDIVVVRSDTYTIVDPQFEATVQNIFFDIAGLGSDIVSGVSQYYHSGSDEQVSDSGHSTIMSVTMAGTLDEARANAFPLRYGAGTHVERDDFTVSVTGEASIADRIAELSIVIFQWPLLYFAFVPAIMLGSVPVSRIPVIIGLISVVVPVGLSALVTQVLPLSLFNFTIVLVTGLSVGMSCSHLIASRYRDERDGGLDKPDAVAMTGFTIRAVLIGGMLATLAVASMAIVPVNTFRSIAFGSVLAIFVTMLASMTLIPSLLALRSDWVSGFRVSDGEDVDAPSKRRFDLRRQVDHTVFGALARPALSVIVTTVVLLALSALALRLNLGPTGVELIPEPLSANKFSSQVTRAYAMLVEDFPAGIIAPVEIIIDAPFKDPDIEPRVAQLQAALASDPGFAGAARVQNNQDHDMVLITVPTRDPPESQAARDAVRRLRDLHIPELFTETGVDVLVTGGPAFAADYTEIVEIYAPYVVAFVVGAGFVGLLIMTRSLAIAPVATLAHLVTFGAAYGLVVLALQQGIGAGRGLLSFHHMPNIESWGVVFSLALLMGVFILRDLHLFGVIRERYFRSGNHEEATTEGMSSVARISTSASLAMAGVFFVLALGDLSVFHQIGFAMTLAVLIDALIVRLVLFPSIMKLLGSAAWYFPPSLRWLPDLGTDRQSLQR